MSSSVYALQNKIKKLLQIMMFQMCQIHPKVLLIVPALQYAPSELMKAVTA